MRECMKVTASKFAYRIFNKMFFNILFAIAHDVFPEINFFIWNTTVLSTCSFILTFTWMICNQAYFIFWLVFFSLRWKTNVRKKIIQRRKYCLFMFLVYWQSAHISLNTAFNIFPCAAFICFFIIWILNKYIKWLLYNETKAFRMADMHRVQLSWSKCGLTDIAILHISMNVNIKMHSRVIATNAIALSDSRSSGANKKLIRKLNLAAKVLSRETQNINEHSPEKEKGL